MTRARPGTNRTRGANTRGAFSTRNLQYRTQYNRPYLLRESIHGPQKQGIGTRGRDQWTRKHDQGTREPDQETREPDKRTREPDQGTREHDQWTQEHDQMTHERNQGTQKHHIATWEQCHGKREPYRGHQGQIGRGRRLIFRGRGQGLGRHGQGFGGRGQGLGGRSQGLRGCNQRGQNQEQLRGGPSPRRNKQYISQHLNDLQNESPSKIVAVLNDKRKLEKFIKLSSEDVIINMLFLQVLDKAFKCATTPALLLNVYNNLRDQEFIRKSIEQLHDLYNSNEPNKDKVIKAIESILHISIWTAQKNPNAKAFLIGCKVLLSSIIDAITSSEDTMSLSSEYDDPETRRDKKTLANKHMDNELTNNMSITSNQTFPGCCPENVDDSYLDIHSDLKETLNQSDASLETGNEEHIPMDIPCNTNDIGSEDKSTSSHDIMIDNTDLINDQTESHSEIEINYDESKHTSDIHEVHLDNDKMGGASINNNANIRENSDLCSTIISDRRQHLRELFNTFKACLNTSLPKKEINDLNAHDLTEFRNLSIIPTLEDINETDNTKLRAIKPKGAYKSVDDFLDVHFRLLREDFISPLRNGILAYNGQVSRKKRKVFQDLKIYENVRIIAPVFKQCIVHLLEFDASKLGHIKWNMSKRLKYGSLVALSNDDFRTVHFATISDSDVRYKRQGRIHVQFEHSIATVNTLMNGRYTMVESPAYFETYRHVLECLQTMTTEDIPLANYIVECNKNVQPPSYLLESECSDFKFELDEKVVNVNVLEDDWPNGEDLHLDTSQLNAFKAALTSEISLIQGPPGCGKTYVGLKIVKTLLDNRFVRNIYERKQLLIVCFTNHALDQFLEGILKFGKYPKKIVRVGSRSSSELLEKYRLTNKRQEYREGKRFPLHTHFARRNVMSAISDLEEELNILSKQVQLLKSNIVSYECLRNVMSNFQKQFQWSDHIKRGNGMTKPWLQYLGTDVMPHWLGVKDIAQRVSDETFHRSGNFEEIDRLTDESITYMGREETSEVQFDFKKDQQNIEREISDFRAQNIAVDLDSITENIDCPAKKLKRITLERSRLKKQLRLKLFSSGKIGNEELDSLTSVDIFNERFPVENRWRMYQTWVERKCEEIMKKIADKCEELEDAYRRKQKVQMLEDVHILKDADVIGMTTTGAAKNINILREVQPNIMIVEEAAEVLESHLISNLTSGCQQLILIGDHKQLKPKPEVYRLEIDYNLNLSLFERLINNDIECHRLQVQHRMRPEIADNIRFVYDDLHDHDSVKKFEAIRGIKYSMYFINHSEPEGNSDELKSFYNEHEALYIVYLCRYLLQQGYNENRITVLTMYKGQMFKIKKEMRQMEQGLENVLVTVVDNYQGEENDIVLLSLVRSNQESRVGFVAKDNRVCVALSRAKKGLYVIGNFELLSKTSSLWQSVVSNMKKQEFYGTELPLICVNHNADGGILARTYTDFNKAPEGGCIKLCDTRLNCGHVCPRKCHADDREHLNNRCHKPCTKRCKNGHPCKKKCFQDCYCEIELISTLPCGHVITSVCSEEDKSKKYLCEKTCGKFLQCGHTCSLKCHEQCVCRTLVKKQLSGCGHEVMLPCCTDAEKVPCSLKCNKMLSCGHQCSRSCKDDCYPCLYDITVLSPECGHAFTVKCVEDVNTTICAETCDLTLDCGHTCKMICGTKTQESSMSSCPIGHQSKCENVCGVVLACGHQCKGKCKNCFQQGWHEQCYESCNVEFICGHTNEDECGLFSPCVWPCERKCKHRQCEKDCMTVCDPCNEPCSWQCKHFSCTKPCGEKCDRPRCNYPCEKLLACGHQCRGCCGDPCPITCLTCDEKTYDKELVIQLQDCGHIFPVSIMDKHMDTDDSYFKYCPKCNTAILTTYGNRYEQLVNIHWNNLKLKKENAISSRLNVFNSGILDCLIRVLIRRWFIFDERCYWILNNLAMSWCVSEICRRHSTVSLEDFSFPADEVNKYTAQSVKDLRGKIKHCLSICKEQSEGNSTLSGSETVWFDTSGMMMRQFHSELVSLKINLPRYSNVRNTDAKIKIKIGDRLPYITCEHGYVVSIPADSKDDSMNQKPSSLYHKERESDSAEVKKAVDFLVNAVCQESSEANEDKNTSSFDGNINLTINNSETQSNTFSTGESIHFISASSETIHILDCLKRIDSDQHVRNVSLDFFETPSQGDDSTCYTIHLMLNPWANFRSMNSTSDNNDVVEGDRESVNQPAVTTVSSSTTLTTGKDNESSIRNENNRLSELGSRKRKYGQCETQEMENGLGDSKVSDEHGYSGSEKRRKREYHANDEKNGCKHIDNSYKETYTKKRYHTGKQNTTKINDEGRGSKWQEMSHNVTGNINIGHDRTPIFNDYDNAKDARSYDRRGNDRYDYRQRPSMGDRYDNRERCDFNYRNNTSDRSDTYGDDSRQTHERSADRDRYNHRQKQNTNDKYRHDITHKNGRHDKCLDVNRHKCDRSSKDRHGSTQNQDRYGKYKDESTQNRDRNDKNRHGSTQNRDRNDTYRDDYTQIRDRNDKYRDDSAHNRDRNDKYREDSTHNRDKNAKYRGESTQNRDRNAKYRGESTQKHDKNDKHRGESTQNCDKTDKHRDDSRQKHNRSGNYRHGSTHKHDRNDKCLDKSRDKSDRYDKYRDDHSKKPDGSDKYTDDYGQKVDRSNKYTDDHDQKPEGSDKYTDDDNQKPDRSNKYTDDYGQKLDGSDKYRDDHSKKPDGSDKYTDDYGQKLDRSNKYTDDNGQKPDGSDKYTDDHDEKPEGSNKYTDDHDQKPEGSNKYTDDHDQKPKGSDKYTDDHDQKPDRSNKYTDDYGQKLDGSDKYTDDLGKKPDGSDKYTDDHDQKPDWSDKYTDDHDQKPDWSDKYTDDHDQKPEGSDKYTDDHGQKPDGSEETQNQMTIFKSRYDLRKKRANTDKDRVGCTQNFDGNDTGRYNLRKRPKKSDNDIYDKILLDYKPVSHSNDSNKFDLRDTLRNSDLRDKLNRNKSQRQVHDHKDTPDISVTVPNISGNKRKSSEQIIHAGKAARLHATTESK